MPAEYEIRVDTGADELLIKADHGDNLLSALQKSGLLRNSPCGGRGICGKCSVKVRGGAPEPSRGDLATFTTEELASGLRLACGLIVEGPLALSIGARNSEDGYEIMTEGVQQHFELDPPVKKTYFKQEATGADDRRSDLRRVSDSLGFGRLAADVDILKDLSVELRADDSGCTATTFFPKLIGIERGDTRALQWGVAVDIGTTTVVCYLVELANGRTLDVEAQTNRQSSHGGDVISRISFTTESRDGSETLRRLIVGQINDMVGELCERNGVSRKHIYNMTLTGNTVMLHLFLGLPSRNIAVAPFTPVTTEAADFRAKDVGIEVGGMVSIMPGIASYVGGDITAGILACGMMDSDELSLLIDLGTNGEMAFGNRRGITTCAVAAGPAFEGGNIKHGVGGIPGAICGVELDSSRPVRTIGGGRACGICGSGVLDAVSELLRHGVLDETGRLTDSVADAALAARLRRTDGKREFVLERDTALDGPIVFTQKDIREVQLAKAAVAGGIQTLLGETGAAYESVDNVYIAGGFGSYMRIESALNIGLIPRELKDKVVSVGNTAGVGARSYLLSRECRQKTARIAESASYIELSNRAEFQEYYIDAINFE